MCGRAKQYLLFSENHCCESVMLEDNPYCCVIYPSAIVELKVNLKLIKIAAKIAAKIANRAIVKASEH